MTKQELEIRNKELEEQLAILYEKVELFALSEDKIKELEKRNQGLVQEVYDARKTIEKTQNKVQEEIKSGSELSKKYNELAQLFDEYIKSTDDIIETSKLFLRNTMRTQELMNKKIIAFNGEEDKK